MTGLFSRTVKGSVASVGEEALLVLVKRWLGRATPPPPSGIGDDCGVLPPARGKGLLTVDPVIFGVHFDAKVPARAAGAKLLKRNLSDIAAMGGTPRAAVVALALDGRVSLAWLSSFYRGLAAEARRRRVAVVGGDVARLHGAFCATLALTGTAAGRILTRSGAKAGDWIYVTGRLGGSLASGRHHSFEPRLAEGRWLARRPQVRSMMDVSDGLAKDLWALAPRKAVPALYAAMLPRRGGSSVRDALCGGEDYELVVSVAPAGRRALETAWRSAFPRTRLTAIGRFVPAGKLPPGALDLADYHGYEHLR